MAKEEEVIQEVLRLREMQHGWKLLGLYVTEKEVGMFVQGWLCLFCAFSYISVIFFSFNKGCLQCIN